MGAFDFQQATSMLTNKLPVDVVKTIIERVAANILQSRAKRWRARLRVKRIRKKWLRQCRTKLRECQMAFISSFEYSQPRKMPMKCPLDAWDTTVAHCDRGLDWYNRYEPSVTGIEKTVHWGKRRWQEGSDEWKAFRNASMMSSV